ncbi:MAG: SOS response-associated peptidase [Hyphomicrobiales bacterium]|nr:SOS response-associated peptidase [Hyphomicrobiales bacterium]
MCGRFMLTATPDEVRRLFAHVDHPNFPTRDDIRPTEPIGVVVVAEGERRFRLVRWGFWPAWVKDPRDVSLLINARAETALEKPSFRGAMRHGRCLVPATGFIEWRRDGTKKTPFRIVPRDGGLVAFAGLTETWSSPDGSEVDTAAILTVDANAIVGAIHDRMPAVIPPDAFAEWLNPSTDAKRAARLLVPAPDDLFEALPLAPKPAPPKPAAAPVRRAPKIGSGGGGQMDLF